MQGYGPLGAGDDGGRVAGTPGQVLLEPGHVAERRRHQHELRVDQLEDRHLPGPASVRVRVEVELIHHHLADIGGRTVPEGDVREDLGGGADDRRLVVDPGVTGEHADVLGTEDLD